MTELRTLLNEAAERARQALVELEEAERAEERALAALPYTRAELEKALQDLAQRARKP